MVYPPYAAPFPDANSADITLGNQQRAALTVLARKPGRVVTPEELATELRLPAMTPRRASVLMSGIKAVLGEDTVVDIPLSRLDAAPLRRCAGDDQLLNITAFPGHATCSLRSG